MTAITEVYIWIADAKRERMLFHIFVSFHMGLNASSLKEGMCWSSF